ncbi:hypothetical protein [Variovorax sp. Sphag1AA]|uniref:hypothetical protein n=1 Tax=Variovorax sp. Sphag1AA TaxID=2587027 RepID=UPI00161FEF61|nr:hypothetical protein [Variovorax sp. Sphag1AA]MBB3180287.1 hypothetical protein [Variovorax sp. Sphag1AA]
METMNLNTLRFSGRDGAPCVPGEPICVHFGEILAGTVDPVPLSLGGSRILLAHYNPSTDEASRRLHKLNFGRVSLLGVTVHIAEHYSNVTTISFLLNREIEGYGGGVRLAGSRSALLQSIGAENIVITPRPEPEHAGQFVVAAAWQYNQQNLASLNAALAAEWKIFSDRMEHADSASGRTPRANAWLRRFLQRRGRLGGSGRRPG